MVTVKTMDCNKCASGKSGFFRTAIFPHGHTTSFSLPIDGQSFRLSAYNDLLNDFFNPRSC